MRTFSAALVLSIVFAGTDLRAEPHSSGGGPIFAGDKPVSGAAGDAARTAGTTGVKTGGGLTTGGVTSGGTTTGVTSGGGLTTSGITNGGGTMTGGGATAPVKGPPIPHKDITPAPTGGGTADNSHSVPATTPGSQPPGSAAGSWSDAAQGKMGMGKIQDAGEGRVVTGSDSAGPAPSSAHSAPMTQEELSAQANDPLFDKRVGRIDGVDSSASPEEQSNGLVRSAKTKMEMRDYDSAIKAATRAIAAAPNNAKAYNLRAAAYNLTGKYPAATADSRRALELYPANPSAYENLAWANLRQGKYQDALAAADRALALNPDSAMAHAIRAMAHEQLGHRKEMLADIEAAALLDHRFREKADAAKAGARLYDPNADDASYLLGAISSVTGGAERSPLVLGVLVLAILTGLGAFLLRRRGASAGVRLEASSPKADGLLAAKYRLGRMIGRGGMGEVLEALDQSLNRVVAIKKLSQGGDPVWREYFLKEARTVAGLRHPAIVDVFEIIEQPDALYLVFERINGKTLHQILAEHGRLALPHAASILRPVCEALEFAHSQGIVHRDLKPANIMVTDQGTVKLMDFGIARGVSEHVAVAEGAAAPLQFDRTKTIAGTPMYMAPETEQGIVSKQADVYSLGVCLYELLTARRPFPDGASLLQKSQRDYIKASQHDPVLPAAVDELIADALHPDPSLRLQSPKLFLDRLKTAADAPQAAPQAA